MLQYRDILEKSTHDYNTRFSNFIIDVIANCQNENKIQLVIRSLCFTQHLNYFEDCFHSYNYLYIIQTIH